MPFACGRSPLNFIQVGKCFARPRPAACQACHLIQWISSFRLSA
jgi:hypothetical protein